MRDLTFNEFSNAWSTYWGRREIGVVVDNPTAARIASQPGSLHTFHDQWLKTLAIFPGDAPLWLMGTPDLTPELFRTPSQDPVGPPPVPSIGRYVTQTPSVSGLSQLAGDYVVTVPKNSPAARTGRRVARGLPGVYLSIFSLVLAAVPFAAVPTAVVGLLLTSQAHWQLRGSRTPRRIRWPLIAGEATAVLSILLAVTLAVTQFSPPASNPREANAMTHAVEGTLTGDIVNRLRLHWPAAEVNVEVADDDTGVPIYVRVRVAATVFLDAVPGEQTWTVRPMTDESGTIRPVNGSRAYGIGVRTEDGAEAIADRFYEEVRFWWAKLHPSIVENGQTTA
jgi:hypothetical protein